MTHPSSNNSTSETGSHHYPARATRSSCIAKRFLQDPAGRFAFLGPFETNLMGQRELFLWIAVPVEPVADSVPVVEMNGAA